jgi:hypothetical protein
MLIRITSSYFCAGIVRDHQYTKCAPIIHYMKDWSIIKIERYCFKKGWMFEILEEN